MGVNVQEYVIWDRKTDGGFPETKELKRRVRDLVEPGRGLGHVDRDYAKKEVETEREAGEEKEEAGRVQDSREERMGEERKDGGEGVAVKDERARGERCEDCS